MTDSKTRYAISGLKFAAAGTVVIACVGFVILFWLSGNGPADVSDVRPIELSADGYVASDS